MTSVAVTVLGGYLGAGKTTLLNRVLAGGYRGRLAVLVNDFGEINVDAELVAAHDGDTIGLTNGCVCCSIGDSLGEALDRVLALDPPVERVLIEASGVADPARIATYGHGWPGCHLDAVVVVAAADTVRADAGDRFVGSTVRRQLAAADVVAVTKTDLVSEPELVEVSEWLAAVAPGVPSVELGPDRCSSELLLGPRQTPGSPGPGTSPTGSPRPGLPGRHPFTSTTVEVGCVPRARLAAALRDWPAEVVRVKGVIQLDGEPGLHVAQRVGRRWTIEDAPVGAVATGLTLLLVGGDRAQLGRLDLDGWS